MNWLWLQMHVCGHSERLSQQMATILLRSLLTSALLLLLCSDSKCQPASLEHFPLAVISSHMEKPPSLSKPVVSFPHSQVNAYFVFQHLNVHLSRTLERLQGIREQLKQCIRKERLPSSLQCGLRQPTLTHSYSPWKITPCSLQATE